MHAYQHEGIRVTKEGKKRKGIGSIFYLPSKEKQRRFIKATLTLLAAFLVFGGPTYLIFIIKRSGTPSLLLDLFGLASFTAGAILFTHLIKEEEKPSFT